MDIPWVLLGRIYYDFRKSRPIMVSYGMEHISQISAIKAYMQFAYKIVSSHNNSIYAEMSYEIWCHRTFEIGHYFSNRFFNANKQMIFVIRFLIRLNEAPIFSDTYDLLLFQDSLPCRVQQVHSIIVLFLDLLIQSPRQ